MSKPDPDHTDRTDIQRIAISGSPNDPRPLRPLVSAGGIDPEDYTHVELDEKIGCILREYARRRAPNRRTIDDHHVGVAGEIAVATWLDVPFDTQITDDYVGDRGYDLIVEHYSSLPSRVEVKTTRKQDPQARVKRARIDNADWFVLCRTNRGADRVEIIGYAPRWAVKAFGDHYGISGYQLTPDYLFVTEGSYITPDEVRSVHHRY